MASAPQIGVRPEGGGIGPVDRQQDGGPYRVVLNEARRPRWRADTRRPPRVTRRRAYGTDFGVHRPSWISRFTDMTRQAASYRGAGAARRRRRPRPLPARRPRPQRRRARRREPGLEAGPSGEGDLTRRPARHVPRGTTSGRCAGQHNTMAQVALTISDERHRALHDTMVELLAMDEPRKRIAAMITGLDIHYDFGHGHPLVGRRMPDLDLHTVDGSARVHPASRRVPCCSTSVISEVSPSLRGRIASGSSMPGTTACGSCRSSAR